MEKTRGYAIKFNGAILSSPSSNGYSLMLTCFTLHQKTKVLVRIVCTVFKVSLFFMVYTLLLFLNVCLSLSQSVLKLLSLGIYNVLLDADSHFGNVVGSSVYVAAILTLKSIYRRVKMMEKHHNFYYLNL